ncbi:MAG: type II toxin-antitoxin system PemK/MazF family toxin [Ignavibacteriales bacterium]|nr:type II toxin-antitoxin system PemK/MazF family toxin [Ignavibacteriales bacterium]
MLKGKILLVPFPFDDLSSSKVRPTICLTEPIGEHEHIVVAFISSQIPKQTLETDILFDSSNQDFKNSGLKVSSSIRLHRLMTITLSLVQRELGELSQPKLFEVNAHLKKLFQL